MLFYLDNWQSSAPEGATDVSAAAAESPHVPVSAQPESLPARPGAARRTARIASARSPTSPQAQNQRRRGGLNENYARELMELHTLGVEGGYTQKDVQEVARAFTGWTIANPRQGGGFKFEPRMHDDGEKVVLGHKIKSGGGQKDGEQVLDILASHPSTAHFVATEADAAFRRRRAATGARRARGGDVPRDPRQHPRGRAHHRHVTGVLRA